MAVWRGKRPWHSPRGQTCRHSKPWLAWRRTPAPTRISGRTPCLGWPRDRRCRRPRADCFWGRCATRKCRADVLRSLRGVGDGVEVRDAVLAWWEKRQRQPLSPPNIDRELAEQVLLLFGGKAEGVLAKRLRPIRETAGARPDGAKGWRETLRDPGDARAGERVFFHPQGPRCYVCHRIDGRGGAIGPDLSRIGAALSRDKLIDSILEPSKEIAPLFTSWLIVTRDGKVRTGVIVGESADSKITVADAQGKLEVINRLEVEERRALPTSIMPADLHTLMTRQEFRDLLAFLQERK